MFRDVGTAQSVYAGIQGEGRRRGDPGHQDRQRTATCVSMTASACTNRWVTARRYRHTRRPAAAPFDERSYCLTGLGLSRPRLLAAGVRIRGTYVYAGTVGRPSVCLTTPGPALGSLLSVALSSGQAAYIISSYSSRKQVRRRFQPGKRLNLNSPKNGLDKGGKYIFRKFQYICSARLLSILGKLFAVEA